MRQSILITGASSGLGRQMAVEFAQRGWRLALAARRQAELEALAAELTAAHGAEVSIHAVDLGNADAAQAVVAAADAALGGLDVVVANAGMATGGAIGKAPFVATQQMLAINVTGTFATVDAAVRIFRSRKSGHIVAVSSVAAWRGMRNTAAYGASKAAVEIYMQGLREELRGSNILATTIFPGYIDTPLNANVKSRPFLLTLEEGGQRIADAIERAPNKAIIPAWPWSFVAPFLKLKP